MYDDRSQIEQHARDLIRVRNELLSHHDTVKKNPRIWQSCRLDSLRPHSPRVPSICSTNLRGHDVLDQGQ